MSTSQQPATLADVQRLTTTAKTLGIHLSLGDEQKASPEALDISRQYLRQMINLSLAHNEVSGSDPGDNDDASEDDDGNSEDDEDGFIDSDENSAEVARLKRKGFPFNPICKYCEDQFDLDDNPPNCCRSHPGSTRFDYEHEIYVDCDSGMTPTCSEFGDETPDAFIWSCCEGYADARGCRVGPHEEDPDKRPRR